MPRVQNIKNLWGVAGGPNPQRSDLWQVDMEDVVVGLNGIDITDPQLQLRSQLQLVPRYVPCAIALPELKIRAEPIRRDSRSYLMPGCDEPLDPIRISFVMDDGGNQQRSNDDLAQSEIYRTLDTWRRVVRAGRGAVGSENFIVLNDHYTISFRFTIYAYLCRGYSLAQGVSSLGASARFSGPLTFSQNATFDVPASLAPNAVQTRTLIEREAVFNQKLTTGLEVSNILMLENCWLGTFRVGDMSYNDCKVLTLDATVNCDNIFQLTRSGDAPITL